MKKLLSLIAAGLAAAGTVSQAAQVDSFDNLGTFGWHDQQSLMFLDTSVFHEGTGSMRVDFLAPPPDNWDNWVTSMDFWAPNQLNWSAYATLSFWTKVSDLAGSERIDQITLWDIPGNPTRYNLPLPTSTDWTQVSIPFSSFVPDGASFDFSQVKAFQIKFTTWDTHAPGTSSVWLDDMQVAVVPEPSALALLGLGLGSLLVLRRKQS
jgi:hypothetical protein